jgi:hypothetical protein
MIIFYNKTEGGEKMRSKVKNFEKEERIKNFKGNGIITGLTFRQAAAVIKRATGNDVMVNPFDERSITRRMLDFGDNNSGHYPSIAPIKGGGFDYTTISNRTLSVYRDDKGWTLDCSQWWKESEYFRYIVVESLKKILKSKKFRDESLPEPEPEHVHGGNELIGQTFSLYYIPENNHGCTGFYVEIKATSPNEGIVVSGSSCSSCWQVGHSDSTPPVKVGSLVRLPKGYCWLCGSEKDPEFMSSRDVSPNGRTIVEPFDLTVIED